MVHTKLCASLFLHSGTYLVSHSSTAQHLACRTQFAPLLTSCVAMCQDIRSSVVACVNLLMPGKDFLPLGTLHNALCPAGDKALTPGHALDVALWKGAEPIVQVI